MARKAKPTLYQRCDQQFYNDITLSLLCKHGNDDHPPLLKDMRLAFKRLITTISESNKISKYCLHVLFMKR